MGNTCADEARFDERPESHRASGWLALAAAPTFAVMALVSAINGAGAFDVFCSAAHSGTSLTGMTAMYALMSLFHAAPWLRRIGGAR